MTEPNLARGHNNPHEWVVYAQKMINHARSGGMHLPMDENGVFDETMENEVIGFQESHGVERTGTIGPKTWAALHKVIEANERAAAAAGETEDDQLRAPAETQHNLPGHKDDNAFHQRTDKHGETVRVYDVDEEKITTDHIWNAVVKSMIDEATANTNVQIPYVLLAVQQFKTSSQARIEQFARDANQFLEESHVEFPWGLLIEALDFGLGTVFQIPVDTKLEKWGNWIYEKVKGALTSQLKADLEARANPVPNLQKRLEDGVAVLVDHVGKQTAQAVDDVNAIIPDYITDRMWGEHDVADNPAWISEMVAWFGFPKRDTAHVTGPILQYLNQQFDAMVTQAEQDLLASR